MNETVALARKFLAEDPDPETRAELHALVEKADGGDSAAHADLADRFAGTLQFGTAGLRGRVEAGTNRMNRAVVIKATWGLGRYLLDDKSAEAKKRGVVIAFDGRLSSRQFAEDAAAVLCEQGVPVKMFFDPVPTPVCAFAVEKLGAAAGIMVTASHNPPADNGYKVYWGNAAQIIPPHDTGIAACIDKAPAANTIARMAPPDAAHLALRSMIPDSLERAYLDAVRALAWHKPPAGGLPQVATPHAVRIVYTAMHGVGHRLALRGLAEAGFDGVIDVPTQADPDGTFRTVSFPNPEEKGALDRAIAVADEANAELILANDPDADRLAVATRTKSGAWRALSGNEIGVLLCADALDHMDTGEKQKLVITTLVSSTFLSRMAKDKGAAYEETLTGFKWIANKAMEKEKQGLAFVCGYEEAIGFSVGPLVRDKDGVGAAVRFAEMTRSLKAQGVSLEQRLDELAIAHGLSVATNWSITRPGASGIAEIKAAMTRLREKPATSLGGVNITKVDDLSRASIPSDVLVWFTDEGTRLTIRPSGTEPKIKMYCEMVGRPKDASAIAAARTALEAQGAAIRKEIDKLLGF
jgi:phosphomannomutase